MQQTYSKYAGKFASPSFNPLPIARTAVVDCQHTRQGNTGNDPRTRISSKVTAGASTAPGQRKVYTGNAVVGIATLHKSNAVPVFSRDDAIEISNMRRN